MEKHIDSSDAVVEIAVPLEKHFYCFHSVAGSERKAGPYLSRKAKKSVEVNIRKCTEAEKELFRLAKEKELDSWLTADAIIPVLKAGISPA